MKLLYTTSIIYPSTLANRIQILQMAKELNNQLGFDNFVLSGKSIVLKDNNINLKNINGSSRSFIFSIKCLILAKKEKIKYIFCREEKLLFFIVLYNKLFFHLKVVFIYEAHEIREKKCFWCSYMLKNVNKIIVLTSFIKDTFIKKFNVDENKILVASDAVDLEKFNVEISKENARKNVNLSPDKKIVMYTGHLYDWKGVQILADANRFLKKNVVVVFVGGKSNDLKKFKLKNSKYKNILILGQKPYKEIPFYLKSADVLILPNSGKKKISKYYTSPMKMFEYMASNVPIVASNLPSIMEILNNSNALLVKADNSKKLSEGINKILEDDVLGSKISKQAYEDVKKYTWKKRVENILEFIK